MALVHENMVDTHCMKIHRVVLAVVNLHSQFGEFGFEVLLPLFKSVLHFAAPVAHGGLFEHFEAALHVGEFFGEYLEHRLRRLGNLGELVVRQNDAIPVVVLYLGEHLFAVGRREIFLTGIKHLSRRIGFAERVGYLVYVGFQSW